MGLQYRFRPSSWGDPTDELLKLLSEDIRRTKEFRRHLDACNDRSIRGQRLHAEYRGRYEAIRDVIHQIHIIRDEKRGRPAD